MVSNKYKGKRWVEARKAALQRDRVCQSCGSSDDLHVHHIRPVRTFDDFTDAHDINNLVVLCSSCHRKWEGRRERPNSLDEDGRVQLSQLVHNLSRDTIARFYEPPGPWVLFEWYKRELLDDWKRCGVCLKKLQETRSRSDYCEHCGLPPRFWDIDDAYTLSRIKHRIKLVSTTLTSYGIPHDREAAMEVADRIWEKDEYHENGWLGDRLLTNAVYAAIQSGYDESEVGFDYEPICPVPEPVWVPN